MAKKTLKTKEKSADHQGKKGGVSAISPEVVGAMTGAAIDGVAGLMLANKKTRENLAIVKDKALESAGEVLNHVQIDTTDLKKLADDTTQDLSLKAEKKIRKSIAKNIK